MRHAVLAIALAAVMSAPAAAAPGLPSPGEPTPGEPVRDPEFRVSTRGFGLERQVQMYQWTASDGGFRATWKDAPIDSSSFPDEYRNPQYWPLDSQRWWARDATLAGRPLDPEVLRRLGRWQRFRPDFSRLPANLAASFQPEGDGLGSSDNPTAPAIGDLRIRWRELVLPDLSGRVELRDGRWRLTPRAAAASVAAAPPTDPAVDIAPAEVEFQQRWWPWLVGGTVAVLAVIVGLRRMLKRRRQPSR